MEPTVQSRAAVKEESLSEILADIAATVTLGAPQDVEKTARKLDSVKGRLEGVTERNQRVFWFCGAGVSAVALIGVSLLNVNWPSNFLVKIAMSAVMTGFCVWMLAVMFKCWGEISRARMLENLAATAEPELLQSVASNLNGKV